MTFQRPISAIATAVLAILLITQVRAASPDPTGTVPSARPRGDLTPPVRKAFEDLGTGGLKFSNNYVTKAKTQPMTGDAVTTVTLVGPDGREHGTLTFSMFKDAAEARAGEGLAKGIAEFGQDAVRVFAPPQDDPEASVNCLATPDVGGRSEHVTCIGRRGPNLAQVSLIGPQAAGNSGSVPSTAVERTASLVADEAAGAMFVFTLPAVANLQLNSSTPQALSAAGLKSAPADRSTAFHATELFRLDPAVRAAFDKFKLLQVNFSAGYQTIGYPLSASARFAEFSMALTGPDIDGASGVTYEVFPNPTAASAFVMGAAVGLDNAWTPNKEGTLSSYTLDRKEGGATHCFAIPLGAIKRDLARCFASNGVYAAVATILVAQEAPLGAQHKIEPFPVNLASVIASGASATFADQLSVH